MSSHPPKHEGGYNLFIEPNPSWYIWLYYKLHPDSVYCTEEITRHIVYINIKKKVFRQCNFYGDTMWNTIV